LLRVWVLGLMPVHLLRGGGGEKKRKGRGEKTGCRGRDVGAGHHRRRIASLFPRKCREKGKEEKGEKDKPRGKSGKSHWEDRLAAPRRNLMILPRRLREKRGEKGKGGERGRAVRQRPGPSQRTIFGDPNLFFSRDDSGSGKKKRKEGEGNCTPTLFAGRRHEGTSFFQAIPFGFDCPHEPAPRKREEERKKGWV